MSEQPRKPKGSPASVGGQYDENPNAGADDLPPLASALTPRAPEAPIPGGVKPMGARDTQRLLDEAADVRIDRDGVALYDADGELLAREVPELSRFDRDTLRHDKRVRRASREIMRSDLKDLSAADRRRTVKAAFANASAYERRKAIDGSPNRRYIPANAIADSLRHRRDKDAAVATLVALHYEDASASANVIRAGFPNDRKSAFGFINKTSIARDKDGRAIREVRVVNTADGKAERETNKRESRGAAARSYLRMMYQPTKGVPDERQTREIVSAFHELDDEPEMQAQAFYELCYGNGTPRNRAGDGVYARSLITGRRPGATERGARRLENLSTGRGQGNAARMAAYHRALTPEAARIFLDMEPGDQRLAHTIWTKRKRNKETGQMENVTPKRLTEMRSFIHAAYPEIASYGAKK
jgi:hypothetical protein